MSTMFWKGIECKRMAFVLQYANISMTLFNREMSYLCQRMDTLSPYILYARGSRQVHKRIEEQSFPPQNWPLFSILKTAKLVKKRQFPICSAYYHGIFLHVYAFLCILVFNRHVFLWNRQRFLFRKLDVFSQNC